MENKLEKKYGLFTAICMVVGIVVGSGVFFKAQVILQKTGGDMPLGILAWLIGGAIMIVCILAFSAMAQKYEKVNGIVDYAEAIVGKRYGYYIGWFLSTTYYPTLTSALAWLSARYTLVFVTSVDPDFPLIVPADAGGCIIGPECLALMLFYMVFAYAVNALSPKLAGKFQVATTVIKFIPLALMAVVFVFCSVSIQRLGVEVKELAHPRVQRRVSLQPRVEGEQRLRRALCLVKQLHVAGEVRHAQRRQTVLPRAEEVARAAQLQILLRQREAALRAAHRVEPRFIVLAAVVGNEDAIRL